MTLILRIFSQLRFPIPSPVLCLELLSTSPLPQQNASSHNPHISRFQLRVLLLIECSVIVKRVQAEMILVQI